LFPDENQNGIERPPLAFVNLKTKELNRQLYAEKSTPVPWDEKIEIKNRN